MEMHVAWKGTTKLSYESQCLACVYRNQARYINECMMSDAVDLLLVRLVQHNTHCQPMRKVGLQRCGNCGEKEYYNVRDYNCLARQGEAVYPSVSIITSTRVTIDELETRWPKFDRSKPRRWSHARRHFL